MFIPSYSWPRFQYEFNRENSVLKGKVLSCLPRKAGGLVWASTAWLSALCTIRAHPLQLFMRFKYLPRHLPTWLQPSNTQTFSKVTPLSNQQVAQAHWASARCYMQHVRIPARNGPGAKSVAQTLRDTGESKWFWGIGKIGESSMKKWPLKGP